MEGCSGSNLPEDIWYYIHSLMSMRDAAQAACVSRAFVHSWRCHPSLDLREQTIGLNKNLCHNYEKARDFNSKIDSILKKHSGIGLKVLKFEAPSVYNEKSFHLSHMDNWLQMAVKPGIEELSLILTMDRNYSFPCSVLSGGTGDLLQCLSLACCHFHPTATLGCLRRLARLHLCMVHITDSELAHLLSGSVALEMLELRYCNNLVCLEIPFLEQLSYLEVLNCYSLRAVKSEAPNLSSVWFEGGLRLQLSETWRIKKLSRTCNNYAFYARTELPSAMPNLEALTIRSNVEMFNTPVVPSKFLHLKFLYIAIGGLYFDYLSLVSFLDASPLLETFILEVIRGLVELVSVFEDRSDPRLMPEHHHSKLRHVKIIKFSAAKSVVELICHILESAASLECLTLDTTHGMPRCSVSRAGKCIPLHDGALSEARKGILAAETFIRPKVPATVEFNVLEPCNQWRN